MKRFLLFLLSFWCCFDYNGEFIRGNPQHFEGWYDETGKEQMVIWMNGERYVVYLDDLTMIHYEDKLTVG